MNDQIRWKLSRAARVVDFVKTHPVTDEGCATVTARLEANVTRADAIARQQFDGKATESGARQRRRSLRVAIRKTQLRRLVTIADIAAKEDPALVGLFVMPSPDVTLKEFLVAARALQAAALPHKDLFISLGIGPTYLDKLDAQLTAYEATSKTANTGGFNHIDAGNQFVEIVKSFKQDVDLLDTFILEEYESDPDVIATWKSTRKVIGPKHALPPRLDPPVQPAPTVFRPTPTRPSGEVGPMM